MIFHLITIQNTRTDDTVFHGFDPDALRLKVATYCRANWPLEITRYNGGMPEDQDILIEAYFYENEREFLIEQEFDLPNISPRWDSGEHWKDHPGIPASKWQHEVAEGNTRLGYHEWLYSRLESEDDLDEGTPDCTACNDGSCPWCQAEKTASAVPRLTLEQAMALHSGDEVTWNDPDDGACTCTFTIQSIQHHNDDLFKITKMDGGYLEALAGELS